MSTKTDPIDGDSPLDRSLRALRQLRQRLAAVEGAQRAAIAGIAVVGMGCRLPGGDDDVHDPEALWRLLGAGRDAVVPPPADRAGACDPPLRAGWLRRVDGFDARFFGVAPREAVRMDPQQRLFLEVAWEALEHAGLPPSSLAGEAAGVFAGVNSSDYFWLQLAAQDAGDTYTITGATHTSVPNRLSYQLDLKGPSMAIDTACSSSLVAVHLACQSLRTGESDVALAGGVNLFLSADVTAVHRCGMPLSPDGRSKTFDAAANGYARGEGCGVVVLKRLADAEADGDRVWAVIRGTAVNQDGRTHGVAAPNGTAQRAVIRQALANAGVAPATIGYIEAHGTGTELGDPIEAEALAEVYGEGRAAGQLALLGAIKTNIGHLEGAAGVAGLIKAVLALDRQEIPRSLHFKRLNPHISLDESRFRIADRARPWPREPAAPRRAAVSSFGAGGTNAHVILEEAPEEAPEEGLCASADEDRAQRPFVLALSADREVALRALAERWITLLDQGALADPESLRDACFTAAVRRQHLSHRAVVVARSPTTLRRRLVTLARDEPAAGVVGEPARAGAGGGRAGRGLVFAFAGMGGHRVDSVRALWRQQPAFRRAVEAVDGEIRQQAGWSVVDALREGSVDPGVEIAQPMLFALQIGLAAWWRACGVVPDAVVGHSLGEVAAARVAGVLSLADAVRVVLKRSQALVGVAGGGTMALVGLAAADAAALATAQGTGLVVAVIMGHRASVLSGTKAEIERVVATLRERNVFCRPIDVDIAFHSPQIRPLATVLGGQLAGLKPRPGAVPFCSTVTGDFVDGTTLDADYWARNLAEPVCFWPAMKALAAKHHGIFLELGAHPVLLPAIRQDCEHLGEAVVTLPSLHRDQDGETTLLRSFGGLHCAGRRVDWPAVVGERRPVTVPGYPWQRQRFWFSGDLIGDEGRPATVSAAADELVAGDRGALARTLSAIAAPRRRAHLLGHVLDEVASVLGLVGDDADLEPDQGFFQLGMDSRMAIELTDRLARALGHALPSTATFEHPTSDDLCDLLLDLVTPAFETSAFVRPALAKPAFEATTGVAPATSSEFADTSDPPNHDHAGDDVVALLRDQIAALETGRSP